MTETSLIMISFGPGIIQVHLGPPYESLRTNAYDTAILLVEVPIMNVLLSLPSQAGLEEKQRQSRLLTLWGSKTLPIHSLDILANTGPGYLANGWKGDRRYKMIEEISVV